MKKKRFIPDPILMLFTILVIIGFQVYWLKDNYDREKKTLEIKTNVAFQETVRKLQTSKLKIPDRFKDSIKGKRQIFIDGADGVRVRSDKKSGEIVTMVNVIRNRMTTSSTKDSTNANFITVRKGSNVNTKDTNRIFTRSSSNDHIYRILYGVDSLQDSIRVPELVTLYALNLKKEKINVPFTIQSFKGLPPNDEQALSDVTVGFAKPVTYHLELKNTAAYLFKKITLPILFSLFLVGITMFSFLLLYRNLVRQQRLAEIKNDFINNITHELKTPIATVGVAIEALKNFNAMHDPEKTKEYLDISGNELQRLGLLVDKVLKLSMFEKKRIELSKEQFDIKLVIQEVVDSMRLQFEKQNAIVNFTAEGSSFVINADKLHITSVVYNLLDNALKYTNDNPKIDVKLSTEQNNMVLKVIDNGIGIATEYRKKIFDKFFRVPTGNRHGVKGYGLGLSYVFEIIKRHNGTIEVESEINKGSTFKTVLPINI